jgi:hypothetical protein
MEGTQGNNTIKLALVRFYDKVQMYVPVSYIKKFAPAHSNDFDPKAMYDVLWKESPDVVGRYCRAQVLMLGGT